MRFHLMMGLLSVMAGIAFQTRAAGDGELDWGFEKKGEGWRNLDGTYWKLYPRAYQGSSAVCRTFYKGSKAGQVTSLDAGFGGRGGQRGIYFG